MAGADRVRGMTTGKEWEKRIMYGWRAKIGLITPMSENAEHAFHIYAPEGVSFASMKINFPGPTPEGLMILTDQLEDTAAKYKGYDVDLVVFGCTSGSCIKGANWDKECIRRIEKASNIPGLTTSTAVLEAFQALGTKKAAVLTPYPEATNEAEKKFLEDNGYEVTNIIGMDVSYIRRDGHKLEEADEYFLYRNAINIGLPILECPSASTAIREGDTVSVNFDTGVITDETTGETFQAEPFPPFIQKIIRSGGLMASIQAR